MSERLNQQQIDKQLQQEMVSFYNTVYTRPMPSNLISLFKDAIFHAVPIAHQIHVQSIKNILSKKVFELMTGEVGIIVNVINATPFDYLYPDLEEALKTHSEIEKLVIAYNQDVAVFKQSQDKKRRTLQQLVQGTGSGNAMKIITKSDA